MDIYLSLRYSLTLALLHSSVIKDGSISIGTYLFLKFLISKSTKRPMFKVILSMRQDTIMARITRTCVMLVVRETQQQMMVKKIQALVVKSFNIILILVAAHETSLLGIVVQLASFLRHNSLPHILLYRYPATHTLCLFV